MVTMWSLNFNTPSPCFFPARHYFCKIPQHIRPALPEYTHLFTIKTDIMKELHSILHTALPARIFGGGGDAPTYLRFAL